MPRQGLGLPNRLSEMTSLLDSVSNEERLQCSNFSTSLQINIIKNSKLNGTSDTKLLYFVRHAHYSSKATLYLDDPGALL
jgi:hypothetical protein